jgi:hypothetical protein
LNELEDADAAEELKVCRHKMQLLPVVDECQVLNLLEKFENEEVRKDGDDVMLDSESGVIACLFRFCFFTYITL